MKYVIWGCGTIGKQVAYMLGGTQKVAAVVENNRKLHGSSYSDIPIISFEEFLLSYSTYPIIVTPLDFEDEIMEQLKLHHIIGAFSFPKELAQIQSLLIDLPNDQILNHYKNYDNLVIYGISLLGLILYDLFLENGFQVSLVMPVNADPSLQNYVKETLRLRTASVDDVKKNNTRLLLAVELEKNDQNELHGVAHDTYYDLHLRRDLFYRPELERFKNIHKGKRCFIVATGPSLRIEDLDTLDRSGEICISVNGILKAFDQTKWRPDYYMVSDETVAEVWKNEILEADIQTKFVAQHIPCFRDKNYDNIFKWRQMRAYGSRPCFSDDFAYRTYGGSTVVYNAMQLAVYMGFQEIYLLGTDCTVSPDEKAPHFYAGRETGLLRVNKIMIAYQVARQYADSHGIEIYNATRGGALEVFPRVDFDSLCPAQTV